MTLQCCEEKQNEAKPVFSISGIGQLDNDGKRFFILMSCHMWKLISDHCKPKCERWNNKAFRGKQRKVCSWLWGRQWFPEYSKCTKTREKASNYTTLNLISDHQKILPREWEEIFAIHMSHIQNTSKKVYKLAGIRPFNRKTSRH